MIYSLAGLYIEMFIIVSQYCSACGFLHLDLGSSGGFLVQAKALRVWKEKKLNQNEWKNFDIS